MIPRKQLDVGWCDLAAGIAAWLRLVPRASLPNDVADAWKPHEAVPGAAATGDLPILACLSVRSGFAETDTLPSVRSTLARLLYLPFDPAMTGQDVERLAEAIRSFA